MTKPRLLFVYDHPRPEFWLDGLWAALNVLEEDFEIERFNLHKGGMVTYGASNRFVLGWGAFGSSVDKYVQSFDKLTKRGLCIAGNATDNVGAGFYDVLFYETNWIKDNYLPHHSNARLAFGVNTDLFTEATIATPVVWDYIGVGALANWKRWEKMAQKKGNRLVIGEYQDKNESESLNIARDLIRGGVMVSNQVSPYDLINYYHWSRTLYMPSDIYGGGERAVLEARACGLNVEIEDDNPKLRELVELETVPSHFDYAKQLKEGILSCLER